MPIPTHIKNSPIYSPIYRRIWSGGNWNWIFDGMTRTGKSTSCISVGDDLDVTPSGEYRFDVDFSVCMSYKKLLKRIDEVGFKKKDRGRVLIWEEASGFEGANSREFASSINIKLAKVGQILGIKGILLIINLPSMFDLDKQIRKLCHSKITMHHFDKKNQVSIGSFKFLEPHLYKNEIFESYSVGQKNNHLNYAKTIEIPFARKEQYQRYLEIEQHYKNKWFKQAASEAINNNSNGTQLLNKKVKRGKFEELMDFLKPRFKEYVDPVSHEINYPKLRYDLYEGGVVASQSNISAAVTAMRGSLNLTYT